MAGKSMKQQGHKMTRHDKTLKGNIGNDKNRQEMAENGIQWQEGKNMELNCLYLMLSMFKIFPLSIFL